MLGIEDLVEGITQATEEGRLSWAHVQNPTPLLFAAGGKGGALEDSFAAELPKHRVLVGEFPHDDVRGVRVILQDRSGRTLDGADANEFSVRYPAMYRLFETARRSAYNVPDVIEEVEAELAGLTMRSR